MRVSPFTIDAIIAQGIMFDKPDCLRSSAYIIKPIGNTRNSKVMYNASSLVFILVSAMITERVPIAKKIKHITTAGIEPFADLALGDANIVNNKK